MELTGHTAGNRLGTLAMRPAPVQATWIGYPNSTGLAGAVDYRLTGGLGEGGCLLWGRQLCVRLPAPSVCV